MGSHKKKSHKKEKEHKRSKKEKKRKKSKKKRHHSSSSSCSPSPVKKSRQESLASVGPNPNSSHREQEEETYEVPLPPGFSTSGNDEPQKIKLPMTKEQYEAKAKEIKKVFDPQTGRHRLIRGEGEIIEEVVSKDRHKQINKQATRGDGDAFQRTLHSSLKR